MNTFDINPSAPTPIYQQVIEQVRRQVISGQLTAGDTLPSVRQLASIHAINAMTFSKAYSLLEAEGLLTRQRGKGMVVAEATSSEPAALRTAHLNQPLDQLILAAQQLDLSDDELISALRKRLEK